MVWEPGEEAWETKLAALRSYHRANGHLAPRQDAVWGEGEAMVPVGQHMANLRRKGAKNGLGKDPERGDIARESAQRACQMTLPKPASEPTGGSRLIRPAKVRTGDSVRA